VKLLILSPEEIKAKANRERFVDYTFFSDFKIEGSKVLVKKETIRLRGDNPNIVPVFGNSVTWEYRKKSGKWIGMPVKMSPFISHP
jgi:hypothetical protein